MLYSTLLRLWDREIEEIRSPKIPLAAEDVNLADRVLVHHIALQANKMAMTFEVLLTADGVVERWVRLTDADRQLVGATKLPDDHVTVVGTHGFDHGADRYETRVLAMRD